MTIDELKAQLSTLTRPQAAEVMRGVRATLEALPPSTTSATDARQRDMLEAFVAGYEMGANPAKPIGKDPRVPASEWERLHMFLFLAEEFNDAIAVIGKPAAIPIEGDSPDVKADKWARLFRMILLRKFYSQGDQVQLPKIAKALRACSVDDSRVEPWASSIEQYWAMRKRVELQTFLGDLLPDTATADPFDLLVYGRLIHADADKFIHTQGLNDFERSIVAYTATPELEETLKNAVVAVQTCIREGLVREPAIGPLD